MTVDDKIGDAKLRYHINKEAAKISALSSSKIDKYELLTVEKILPSDQSRIIEQAKFPYPLLQKAFGKQTKAIEDEKKIETIEQNGKQLVKSNVLLKNKNSISLDKQKEIFYKLVAERTREIEKLHNIVNFQNLVYHLKDLFKDIYFNDSIDTETLFDDTKSKEKKFEDVEKIEWDLNRN